MPTTYIKISTDKDLGWLEKPSNNPRGMARALITFLRGSIAGSYKNFLQIATDDTTANASGTVTAASVAAADTVTIGGSVLTAQDQREIRTVVCVADSSGSLNSKWWKLYSALDETYYYVWYNVNDAGVDPEITDAVGIEVAIDTDAADTDVASATKTALDAIDGTPFITSRSTATLTITNVGIGDTTNSANGTASPGFTITTTNGGASTLSANKFSMNTSDDATASSLAAVINSNDQSGIDGYVTASATNAIVTITALTPGKSGNLITLATSNSGRLAKSGTVLANGTNPSFTNYKLSKNAA